MILFLCAFLTVVFETPWMYIWGYRRRDEVLLVVCVNVATNLLLNLIIAAGFSGRDIGALIYAFEAAVIASEYVLYSLAFGFSKKLFLVTLGANCLSYGLGLLIF